MKKHKVNFIRNFNLNKVYTHTRYYFSYTLCDIPFSEMYSNRRLNGQTTLKNWQLRLKMENMPHTWKIKFTLQPYYSRGENLKFYSTSQVYRQVNKISNLGHSSDFLNSHGVSKHSCFRKQSFTLTV